MSRTVKNINIASYAARSRLTPSGTPYWHAIDRGLHLGYRKGKCAGRWVVRLYNADKHDYVLRTIATADDNRMADGRHVLDYRQAQDAARRIREMHDQQDASAGFEYAYTVADAMDDYVQYLRAFGKSAEDAKYRIEAFIKPELGKLRCDQLTASELREWFIKLAETPARLRSNDGQQYREFDRNDPEAVRKRRHSANKVLTMLKAGLNRAWQDNKIASDSAWRWVKPFRAVDASRIRCLEADEIKRLREASPVDLRTLIDGALLTGCRYGELAAMQVRDYHQASGTLRVIASKTGKHRDVILADQAKTFFNTLTTGRADADLMFRKANGERWKKSHQGRPLRKSCQRAKIDPPLSFHIFRHTYASWLVMAGVPMTLVCENLGHADTRMTERHYAHLAPSHNADLIRKLAPSFGAEKGSKT